MGTGKATPANQLSTERVLEVQLAEANGTIRMMSAALAALLMEKHKGRALVSEAMMDLAFGDPTQPNGYLVNIDTLHGLKTHRLQVYESNGSIYVPAPETIEASQVEKPSEPCGKDWHRTGTGLRCPDCGSSERIS